MFGTFALTMSLSFCWQSFCLSEYTRLLSFYLVLHLESNVVILKYALFVSETPNLQSNCVRVNTKSTF